MRKITVITSMELTPRQQRQIESVFVPKYKERLEFVYLLDQAMVGGIVVFDGEMVYDGSVKTKITQIRSKLIHG
ncbi:MAG: F0F1 ATP synthase subunit delta [Eubacteriales bacterium]